MSTRMALREIKRQADVNASTATHATYFPFFEYTRKIGYACGVYGWNGSLLRGMDSGALYAVTDYGNEDGYTGRNLEKMGEREKYVIRTLSHVEEVEHEGAKHSLMRFYSNDGEHSFYVVTNDYGHTWEICG